MSKRLQSEGAKVAAKIGEAAALLDRLHGAGVSDEEIGAAVACAPITIRRYRDGESTISRFMAARILERAVELQS